MVESSSEKHRGSRLISRLLPPAIRLWLSTQLDHVEDLVFQIEGRDREILAGHLPAVALAAKAAVYQGIHLSQAAVTAQAIRINLGQVLRRQPLRLLAPFSVSGNVFLTTADLNQSLRSPLLGAGLYDFLHRLAQAQPEAAYLQGILQSLPDRTVLSHYEPVASIAPGSITLRLTPKAGLTVPAIAIMTQLTVQDGHCLCLQNPHWLNEAEPATPLPALHGFVMDLGPTVNLTEFAVEADQLSLAGSIRILPAATEQGG
ncbi:MAG TPA: DUF2993 domain-containing protein [Candidatus Obscuribacterales bacterium]